MRLQRHLNEDRFKPEQAWDDIKRRCQPFLRDWMPIIKKDKEAWFLYRGMNRVSNDYGHKAVRKDREPMDSDSVFHKEVDFALQQVHKISGRSKAVFVSGDDGQAVQYGNSYMIFPMGKYRFLWSDKIRDLWIDAPKYGYIRQIDMMMRIDRYVRERPDLEDTKKVRDEVRNMFDNQNNDSLMKIARMYKTTNLNKAIKSSGEIMIDCEEYIYVKSNWAFELEDVILNEIK